jgi:acetyl-CoA acetyltransferase
MKPAVVVGVGETKFEHPDERRSGEALTYAAITSAAADAGIPVASIDGICKYSYDGVVSDTDLARELGFREVRYSIEVPHGGGSCGSVLQAAVMAVQTGVCEHVVCYRTVVAMQWFRQMQVPDRARPYYFDAKFYLRPAGFKAYQDMFAALFAEHSARFGTRREHLGTLAIAAREHALRHDNAALDEKLTMDDYLAAPSLWGSLSHFDDLTQVDGSVALIITSAERAADLSGSAVPILAVGESSGPFQGGYWEQIFLRPDPFDDPTGRLAKRLYGELGISATDIDVSLLYDCTTMCELMALEQYGLIPRGQPDAVLQPGFGGTLVPVNTHGGNLAGGYIHGFSQVAEGVRQMRGQASNQVSGAELALIGGPPTAASSAAILGKAAG